MSEKMVEKAEEKAEEKMVDPKDIILKVKSVRKLFYMNTVFLMFVCLLPYMIPYVYPEISNIKVMCISAIMMTIVMIFYIIIIRRLSSVAKVVTPPAKSLVEKIMSCELRIKNGLNYCAKCPDSYACASQNGK